MNLGGRSTKAVALLSAGALIAGCTTDHAGLEVRAIKDPAAAIRAGNPELAQAQAYLALGNAGLALETFRKINRARPSAAAYAGIAACYTSMGRFDLAQVNYEAALALAPNSPSLLTALAATFDREGMFAEAARARHDAQAARADLPAAAPTEVQTARSLAPVSATTSDDPPMPRMSPGANVSVALPPARIAQMQPMTMKVSLPTIVASSPVESSQSAAPVATSVPPAPPPIQPQAAPVRWAEASSVTVPLPPARPAGHSDPRPASRPTMSAGPRLERLTMGEVALVTTVKPLWSAVTDQPVVRSRQIAASTRWTPLNGDVDRPPILILNAARSQGLAANAKAMLHARGWRGIDVGDASAVRQDSVVLYPATHRRLGRRLAAQFGIPARPAPAAVLTVYLGRDSTRRAGGRQQA